MNTMKRTCIFFGILFLFYQAVSQEMDIRQLPPQDRLELGAMFGNLEIVKAAMADGADINYSEKLPLCKAIYGANPPTSSDEGNYVQMMASIYGITIPPRKTYIELIKWFLQNGAQANASSDFDSDNIPLLLAAECRDLEVIKLLLDFKADPNSENQTGTTALHKLTFPVPFHYPFTDSPEIAKLLISKGAKMISGEYIPSPLNMAKENLMILEDSSSPWRDYPFYDEMVNSIKSLIEIYSQY